MLRFSVPGLSHFMILSSAKPEFPAYPMEYLLLQYSKYFFKENSIMATSITVKPKMLKLQKLLIYQGVQVQYCWLVNPEEQTLHCFSLRNCLYALVAAEWMKTL
ncbi:MAG: hypothetical protein APF76_10625 [Desulfitibacter sp. BRH_c19]|nr:MAG: hypothetical protein APF76_10625 [Desulfitibacter sp. BRH_c19]